MGEVVGLSGKKRAAEERRAKDRQRREMQALHEVNAYVNHHPQARVTAGMTHSKTMHHGVDLCSMLAKYDKLAIVHKIHPMRFMFAISEAKGEDPRMVGSKTEWPRQAVLLVQMPDKWYVLSSDDFVYGMDAYREKIIETAEKVGVWKVVVT